MPKTNITTILKEGAATKIETIDYSTKEQQKKLKDLKEKSEISLGNKWVNQSKLANLYIRR